MPPGYDARMPDAIALARSVLATSVDRWAAIARMDSLVLDRTPATGQWSAVQCLQHVVDTEPVFGARVQAILDGATFQGFDPDAEGNAGRPDVAPVLAARLGPMRQENLAALASLVPADLARTGTHAELGIVTMEELLNEWAAHDTMHLVQAERAVMQAFIPGSGPWRGFFADHDVDAPAG
jgi:hypothetical protein